MVGICMLEAIKSSKNEISFSAKQSDEKKKTADETRILPNNYSTRTAQKFQKTSSAFLDYPVKGLKGDVNSNFYEFLTMGIVPYLAGSATFMFVFNAVNKHLNLFEKEKASTYGKKMALGVVLYGLMKNISKSLVTKPVKMATGVDVEMPYENIVYPLPKNAGEEANIEVQHQQRKVFDSKEFYRKDLLQREYFDNVASKLGLGDNLNDSISETSPIIQNIVATSNTAKSLSSYCWAAVGVGLAVQDSWLDFFGSISNRKKYTAPKDANFFKKFKDWNVNAIKNIWKSTVSFVKSFGNAFIQMWKGKEGSFFSKHTGKILITFAKLATTFLTANTIIRAKNMAKNKNKDTIDRNKKTTVI